MKTEVAPGIIFADREQSGLPKPHNNDGTTPRPLLNSWLEIITAHYPGSPVGTTFRAMDGDVKKKTYIQAVQRNAVEEKKSFEYNFFIFMDGEIWEYAGDYLAAHSAGENAESYGVQFVNGQDDLCTDRQVRSYQWLRDVYLARRNRIIASAVTTPHRQMPGAATQCPGDRAIMPRLEELRQPYNPVIVPPVEDKMTQYLIQDPTGIYVTGDFVSYRAVSPTDLDFFLFHSLVEKNADGSLRVLQVTDHRNRMYNVSPEAVNLRIKQIVDGVVAKVPTGGTTPEQINAIISGTVNAMPKSASFTLR